MPLNPYSGGDVVVNSNPSRDYYLMEFQKKQARKDALDQHYANMASNINTAGVRTYDVNDLSKKINDWQDFYFKNKDAILDGRKDNYRALTEFETRHRDILNGAALSKAEGQRDMQIGTQLFNLKKDDTLTPEDLAIAQRRTHSVFSPDFYKQDGHTPYTLDDFTIGTPMPKQDYVNKFLDDAKGDLNPTTIDSKDVLEKGKLPYQYTQKKVETIGFDNNTLHHIANNATAFNGDKGLEKYFQAQYENPYLREQLNPLFKAATGRNIGEGKDEKQGAVDTAYAMALMRHGSTQNKVSESKVVDEAGMRKYFQDRSFSHDEAMQREKLAKAAEKAGGDLNIKDIYGELQRATTYDKNGNQRPTGREATPLNDLSATAQKVILDYATPMYGKADHWYDADGNRSNKKDDTHTVHVVEPIDQRDIYIKKDGNKMKIIKYPEQKEIGAIDFTDANLPLNKTKDARQKVLREAGSTATPSIDNNDPLGILK